MRDEGELVPEKNLTPAQRAVLYALRRCRLDVNFRWYMLGTQTFAHLCEAEAERTGTNADAVMEQYSTLADHCKGDVADVERLRRKLEEVDAVCAKYPTIPGRVVDQIERIASDVPAWLLEDRR